MFCNAYRVLILLLVIASATAVVTAQETITGTIVSYGSGFNTRMRTGSFTLRINRYTSNDRAQRLLGYLQEGAEDRLKDSKHQWTSPTIRRLAAGRVAPIAVARDSISIARGSLARSR